MTLKDFVDKLSPFFSYEEIAAIENEAEKSYTDAHGHIPIFVDDWDMVYNFVLDMMYDNAETLEGFNRFYFSIIGREFSEEEFSKLTAQMDKEW